MSKSADSNEETNADNVAAKSKKKLPIGLCIGFLVCFLLSIASSAGITYFLMSMNNPSEEISKQQAEIEAQVSALRQSIEQQNAQLRTMNTNNEQLKTYLRHSSATALKNILINQEENIQAYLSVMRQAVGDLSELVPKSSEWETTYQYQMDLALKASMERSTLLNLLKTGEPPVQSEGLPAQTAPAP
ncbi:MAG: hypothetical protein DSY86_03630 [Marinomonas sp.]|jgi:hypothetical protein|nr:MAG: hypothetical protein DSY86_03630 [Marinomonas sp.]